MRYEEKSPYCFQSYDGEQKGSFQISCYSESERALNKNFPAQSCDTANLEFIKTRMEDDEFLIHLWFATVEDHTFIIKYVCDLKAEHSESQLRELEKVEQALSTLRLISENKREFAIANLRIENFIASLAASFDLRNKAMEHLCFIEMTVIVANQIDAHLRMAIMLKQQLEQNTNAIDISLLYQGDNDKVVMERKIYDIAKNKGIITNELFDKLEALYKERNKVVHRYIITDFKTRDLSEIAVEYLELSEVICDILKKVEDEQIERNIGYYGSLKRDYSQSDIRILHAKVNDKHLTKEFHRKISLE